MTSSKLLNFDTTKREERYYDRINCPNITTVIKNLLIWQEENSFVTLYYMYYFIVF
jgi:hypothetical protein